VSGPNGKLEWKRYKQYTKDDILAAIEEVKSGEFNACVSFTDGCYKDKENRREICRILGGSSFVCTKK
jgi:hypothetical protein